MLKQSEVGITHLPSDLLVLIISLFTLLERRRLAFVNKKFHGLITGEHFWLQAYNLLNKALVVKIRHVGINYQKLYSFFKRGEDIEKFLKAKEELVAAYRKERFIQNYKTKMIAQLRDYKPTKKEAASSFSKFITGLSSLNSPQQGATLTDEMKKDAHNFQVSDLAANHVDLYFKTWKEIEALKDIEKIKQYNASLQGKYKKATESGLTHTLYLCAALSARLLVDNGLN